MTEPPRTATGKLRRNVLREQVRGLPLAGS